MSRTDGKTTRRGVASAVAICGLVAPLTMAVAATPSALAAQSSSYMAFEDLTRALEEAVDASELASMRSIGMSLEGREIWLVEIAADGGPPTEERPGVLVVGNLSGDHLTGSHLALEVVRHLTGPGSGDADLDEHVIYVVPRLNPDAAEAMFSGPADGRRRNARPHDDDNDGRTDEDTPDDVNGDGVVTVMRVPDPAGEYRIDADDPRVMHRVDRSKGERGTHSLHWEGVDDDGDGYLNEDGPGGVDLDRNFQHDYPYWEPDAGAHMVSEPESRALMDFVIGRRNIAAIVTFGHSDNLVTPPSASGALADPVTPDLTTFADASFDGMFEAGVYPVPRRQGGLDLRGAQPGRDNDPSSGRRPETTVNGSDVEYFQAVSDAYSEATGISRVPLNRPPRGAFFQYGYFQYGVPSFSTPGWGLPEVEDAPADGDGALLAAFDAADVDAFVDWSPAEHPELGSVEVGGFHPYASVNAPPAELAELGRAHGAFVATVSTMLPRVRLVEVSSEDHGGGVYTVTAVVTNEGYLPSALEHGIVSRSVDPVLVQIQVPQEEIVTGAAKSHRIPKLEGSGARERVSWVIRGSPGESVEIRVLSQKGGADTRSVRLGGDR